MEDLNNNGEIQNVPKHYLLGIVGAFLGGFIASIPWILMYLYGNMILSALSIIIAISALKGYQIFKGTIDNKLPVIISIVSLLVVIITTLFITPMLLIIQEGYEPTIANLKILYNDSQFFGGIIHDFIISIVFTILGISGVVANIKRQIKESDVPLDRISISDSLSTSQVGAATLEKKKSVKDIFIKYEAMSKQNTIDKQTIFSELEEIENGKQSFNMLKNQQIIRKHKGKYYFSEKAENHVGYRFGILFVKYFLCIFVFTLVVILLVIFSTSSNNSTQNNTSYTNSNSSYSSQKTSTYELSDFGMKIVAPKNMTLTTSSRKLNSLLGDDASSLYKFAIYNNTSTFSCFVKEADIETIEEYYVFLKESFEDYTIISDYQKETISGFEFTTIEAQTEYNGTLYNDICLGHFYNDKFVFFEYVYPTKNNSEAKKNLETIITKM